MALTRPAQVSRGTRSTGARVLIVDDSVVARAVISKMIGGNAAFTVVGAVGDAQAARVFLQANRVDIILLDIEMPGADGIEAAAAIRIHLPDVRSLIVTTFGRPGYLRRAIDAGASGFVVKDTPAAQLADAVRRVHAGLRVVDPTLATESLASGDNPLTSRETDVLRAALSGATVATIAAQVHLSAGTVRNHLSSAIGKTGASTRGEAAHIARDRGWI